jgi:chromate reductase, NAD(P)H dehydrogenase (quinone)
MARAVHILGICGSLRKDSMNRKLLRAAGELLPPDVSYEIAGIEGIPVYNQDDEANIPPAVAALKEKIRKADAILFGTPEYNYGIPGALKNAIDWASRPYGDNAWKDKPVAAMSVSVGMLGGARAVYQLRQSYVFLDMYPLSKPEVFVSFGMKKFDEQGRFIDEDGRKLIGQMLQALADWTRRLQASRT